MPACTRQEYDAHLAQALRLPQVRHLSEQVSIHRDEYDSFTLAHTDTGKQVVIAYQDAPHYEIFPVGQCPVLPGQGLFQSVYLGLRRVA